MKYANETFWGDFQTLCSIYLNFLHADYSYFTVAPLDENDYSPAEDQSSESPNSQKAKFRSYEASCNGDFPSLLNLPLGSDGQGSHDSHNDSGYSTRFGYSAGPSPSLSGI